MRGRRPSSIARSTSTPAGSRCGRRGAERGRQQAPPQSATWRFSPAIGGPREPAAERRGRGARRRPLYWPSVCVRASSGAARRPPSGSTFRRCSASRRRSSPRGRSASTTSALLAIVMAAAGFFQTLLDLTVEEAVTKYGFRYATAERWGRLRRLFARALAFKGSGAVARGARAGRCSRRSRRRSSAPTVSPRRCSSPRSCRSRRRPRGSPARR